MKKKLNITFCSFPDFSSNAKPLYEYMYKKYGDKFNYTWIVYNEDSLKKLKEKGVNAILIGTDDFKKYISTTDVFFTTQGNLDGDKTSKSVYVELWHGIGPKPTGYMCKNPSDADRIGYNNMRKIFDYVVAPNDFWRTIYSSKFHVEYSRTVGLGMPKLDYFKYSDGKRNIEKILNVDVKKYKKLIIYMPTFKNGFNHCDSKDVNINNIFNFESYDEEELIKYLRKNKYLLCVKRHPGDNSNYVRVESEYIKNIDDKLLFDNDLSINEIINAFDMLITDYSSIGVEYSYFKRPILYAVGDYDEYEKNRGIVFSNVDFWLNGPKVKKISDFFVETDRLFSDETYYAPERNRANRLFFSGMIDGGCDRICNFLFTGDGKLNKKVRIYVSEENRLMDIISLKQKTIDDLENQVNQLRCNIDIIINSKGWKFLEFIRRLRRKFFRK